MASRLNLPARKMFIRDLVNSCKASEEILDISGLNVWKCLDALMGVTYSVVWIQGTVKVFRCVIVISKLLKRHGIRAGKNLRFLKKVFRFSGFNVYAQSHADTII